MDSVGSDSGCRSSSSTRAPYSLGGSAEKAESAIRWQYGVSPPARTDSSITASALCWAREGQQRAGVGSAQPAVRHVQARAQRDVTVAEQRGSTGNQHHGVVVVVVEPREEWPQTIPRSPYDPPCK